MQLPRRADCKANRAHLLLMRTYAPNLPQFYRRGNRASCDEDTSSVRKHVVKRVSQLRHRVYQVKCALCLEAQFCASAEHGVLRRTE